MSIQSNINIFTRTGIISIILLTLQNISIIQHKIARFMPPLAAPRLKAVAVCPGGLPRQRRWLAPPAAGYRPITINKKQLTMNEISFNYLNTNSLFNQVQYFKGTKAKP
jgi:hypothetical protein